MGAILGGVGLGLVWGWWLVMVSGPKPSPPITFALVVSVASLVLAAGIYGLVGLPPVLGLLAATAVGGLIAIAVRTELQRGAQG